MTPSEELIVQEILRYGGRLKHIAYTNHRQADTFIRQNPNAWLFGVIFAQGIPYEKAWAAPYLLQKRLGHFDMKKIAAMSPRALETIIRGAPGQSLHRFVRTIPRYLIATAQKLLNEYQGDASSIWKNILSANEVISRLVDFQGISHKKAHMAARILHEGKKANFSHWKDINIAVDTHAKRVWTRTGLVQNPTIKNIMEAAKKLKPNYPGELDFPTWMIGMNWCHPREPDCWGKLNPNKRSCPLVALCPKIGTKPRSARKSAGERLTV